MQSRDGAQDQENAPMSPDPFLACMVGSGNETNLMWTSNPKYTISGLVWTHHNELSYLYSPPDPTLIVENVVGVMENVAVGRRKEVWSNLGIIPDPQLKEIYEQYSTEEQRMYACADIYVNCHPESSWTHLWQGLYVMNEMTAARKVKSFIPQTGKQ